MTVAVVQNVTGEVWVRAEDGSLRQIRNGDQLMAGEVIVTGADGSAELVFDAFGGGVLELLANQILELSENIQDNEPTPVPEALVTEASASGILDLLQGEGDLLAELDAAAAGLDGGGATEDDGHGIVRVGRIAENTDPLAFGNDPSLSPFAVPLPEGPSSAL
ncbi:MAG: retention module-containing protein, partial [Wenzhouxiangella sp.]|nr:retention module-containing protein [Wenzhouxiangella sp.]